MKILNNSVESYVTLEKDAADFGFTWPNALAALDQASSECAEIKEAIEQNHGAAHLQEEIGDLLQAVISLCVVCEFDVHETLSKANEKFNKRLTKVKELTVAQGLENLHDQSVAFKLGLWDQAKTIS